MRNKNLIILELAAALILMILIVSCGAKVETSKDTDVESIIKAYDENQYFMQRYDENMIAVISSNLTLKSEIVSITYIIKEDEKTSGNEWTYIYEFMSSEDAVNFETNRVEYCKTIDNGVCVRFGNIVVFGNSDVISERS